jgi:uncharacterized pyridoxal phosphate-dependent enzyme
MKPQPLDPHLLTRRDILHGGGALALGVLTPVPAAVAAPSNDAAPPTGSSYAALGVRPLINARGTVTIVGATRTLPEVKRAMEAAAREYVQMDELMDGVARRLAQLTGAEWGLVTSGASAALTAATAACIAGGDPDRMAQLPDLRGLKDEVIAPRYSRTAYDHAIKAVGARIVEVETRDQLIEAFGPRTAMVMVLAGSRSEEGPLSLREIAGLAKPRGIPILVDAAADALVVPNPYLEQGADLVAYSGGKCLRGPQCAGLLLGTKPLVEAARVNTAPHHGLGRGLKVGREEIMGMLAAVEAWMRRDHETEMRTWRSWLAVIASRVGAIPGVTAEMREPRGLSNRTPSLLVRWDIARIPLSGETVEQRLWDGEPRIAVGGAGSFLPFPPNAEPTITIVPYQLEPGEERIIADRVYAVLSTPQAAPPAPEAPAFDLSGRWNVEVTFYASSARQAFALEQKGGDLRGTHHASFAARDLTGTLRGRTVVLRSSYTSQGVRLNFTFTGGASADGKVGDVSLGEYCTATWKATRA